MTNLRTDSDDPETKLNWQLVDANQNRWWIDAFTTGKYPEVLVKEYGVLLSQVFQDGDEALLKVDNDFLGVNYYCDGFVGKARMSDRPMNVHSPYPINRTANMDLPETEFVARTDFNWPITPEGLGNLVLRIHHDWPEIKSILITENGAAFNDSPNEQGEIEDHRRVDYMHSHLESLRDAIDSGAPVDGYFAWSLWDNFEWAEGYSMRFGIVYVDFETLKRTPKLSFKMYQKYISQSRLAFNS
jgi:beta-glucosidase